MYGDLRNFPDPGDQMESRQLFVVWVKGKSEAMVRAALESNRFVSDAALAAREYLHAADETRLKAAAEQARIDTAASIEAAKNAARVAQKSAFWTAVAAVASTVAALVSLWQVITFERPAVTPPPPTIPSESARDDEPKRETAAPLLDRGQAQPDSPPGTAPAPSEQQPAVKPPPARTGS